MVTPIMPIITNTILPKKTRNREGKKLADRAERRIDGLDRQSDSFSRISATKKRRVDERQIVKLSEEHKKWNFMNRMKKGNGLNRTGSVEKKTEGDREKIA